MTRSRSGILSPGSVHTFLFLLALIQTNDRQRHYRNQPAAVCLLWKGKKGTSSPGLRAASTASRARRAATHIVLDGQQRLTAMYYAFIAPDVPAPSRRIVSSTSSGSIGSWRKPTTRRSTTTGRNAARSCWRPSRAVREAHVPSSGGRPGRLGARQLGRRATRSTGRPRKPRPERRRRSRIASWQANTPRTHAPSAST